MEENLKTKQNKNKLYSNFTYSAISFISANCAFADSKTENLSDEIFNAAMQAETPDKYNGISNITDTQTVNQVAEQAAEQTGQNFVQNITEVLKGIGNSISGGIDSLTGGNLLVTKLILVFVLVFISIAIIVILILLAKKFVFKQQPVSPFEKAVNLDEEFDESKFEDEPLPYNDDEDIDEVDDFDEDNTEESVQENESNKIEQPEIKRPSRTMIPPKSTIEHEPEPVEEEFEEEIKPAEIPIDENNSITLTESISQTESQKIAEPKDIPSAMQVFLKVTAE